MSKTRRKTEEDCYAAPKRVDTGLPFELTLHALERFRDRMAGVSLAAARHEMKIIARSAKRTESRTRHGDDIWVATNGDPIRFVIKRDGSRRICVTTLLPLKDVGQ